MSSAAPRSLLRRVVDGLCLLLVFSVAYVAMPKIPARHGDAMLVASLGLLLLAGMLTSKLIEIVKVPHPSRSPRSRSTSSSGPSSSRWRSTGTARRGRRTRSRRARSG